MNTKLESLLASVTFGLLVLMILLIASNVFGRSGPVAPGYHTIADSELPIVSTAPATK
jgi:hypothetical protein